MKTEILAVMFSDIVGYTERTSNQTYEENAELLLEHAQVVHPIVRRLGGRVIKEIGDGVLATFASPTRAVEAAMAIQDRLSELNRGRAPEEELHLRIAINVGEVRVERRDVFGDGVNVAARIQAETPVDEIYISGSTYLTMNRSSLPFAFLGQRYLKGLSEPVTLFCLPRFAMTQDDTVIKTKAAAALPYAGRQLAYLAQQRRRQLIRSGALAATLTALLGAAIFAGFNTLRARSFKAEIAHAVAVGAWQDAAATVAAMAEAGQDTGPAVEHVFQVLADPGQNSRACRALDFFEEILLVDPQRRDQMARLRLLHAFQLLRLGELAQADVCLDRVAFAATSPERRLLELARIHHDALTALAAHDASALWDALRRYEVFLRAGATPAEHLQLAAEVAVSAYQHAKTRALADSLVAEYLGASTVPILVERALSVSTPPAARAWLVARLETLAAGTAVDWEGIYAAQLDDPSCSVRKSAVERLRRLNRLSATGLLLREAMKGDACTRSLARTAAQELVASADAAPGAARPSAVVMASRY